MEYQNDTAQLLDLMVYPAFSVQDGTVIFANREAAQAGICANDSLDSILVTGQQEYANLQAGSLYLTVRAGGNCLGATVSRLKNEDIFVLDQDAQREKLQTMALAAQQLRAPLSNIMTVADDLFPMVCQEDDPAKQALAARINRGLYQMLRIIGNMSDAYRYNMDTEPQLELRNVCGLWNEFWTNSIDTVSHADIKLQYSGLQEDISCLVDAEKLERAASNLLANALKFTPKGGTIQVRLSRRNNMLCLSVLNSGDAIPEELRGSIFTRYQRQPGIEDRSYGIGLGMVLVRAAAAVHGGTVLMEHLTGQGTRVTMTIRIDQDADNFVRSPIFHVDYAGERDHRLIELSESLPPELYYN